MDVRIEQSWKNALAGEFDKAYFASLVRFLRDEKAAGRKIFPPGSQIFRAFELTPVDKVKVVILGQDPYHGAGQAHGLSFSVPLILLRQIRSRWLSWDRIRTMVLDRLMDCRSRCRMGCRLHLP